MNGKGVFRLRDCIGPEDCAVKLPDGRWVRAVPERFDNIRTRVSGALEVLRGNAAAMQWPEPGDLEYATACRAFDDVGAPNGHR